VTQVFSDEQIKLLNTPLTRDEIGMKEGQRYLPSHIAIAKANRIFGPGNWGFHITSPFETMDTGKTTKNGSIIYRVRVQVTLEVRGAMPITDIGDCEANGTTAPAMGMAEKGAVSDGVKRCLRIYGSAFGLDLYDDDWKPETQPAVKTNQSKQSDTQAIQPPAEPLPPLVADFLSMYDSCTNAKDWEAVNSSVQAAVNALTLTVDQANKLIGPRKRAIAKNLKIQQ